MFFFKFTFTELSENNKLWMNYDQKDFFMLFFFLTPIISVILFNSTCMVGGDIYILFILV